MKKQVFVFFIIMIILMTLAQVLFLDNMPGWQILLQSFLAGLLSTLFFGIIIKKRL